MKLTFRKFIVYILLALIVIYLLAYHRLVFSDEYSVRKWIWYLLGLIVIAFLLSRKNFEGFFKYNAEKPGLKKIFTLLLYFIIGSSLLSSYYPIMNLNDAKKIYQRNAVRFQQIVNMHTNIMNENNCARCVFENPHSGFHKDCDSFLSDKYADFKLSDGAQDTIQSLMSDLDVMYITFEEHEVSFHFDFWNSPHLIMLDSPTATNTKGLVSINRHYFLMANKN